MCAGLSHQHIYPPVTMTVTEPVHSEGLSGLLLGMRDEASMSLLLYLN